MSKAKMNAAEFQAVMTEKCWNELERDVERAIERYKRFGACDHCLHQRLFRQMAHDLINGGYYSIAELQNFIARDNDDVIEAKTLRDANVSGSA